METVIFIAILVVFAISIYFKIRFKPDSTPVPKPDKTVPNNKLIIIKNTTLNDARQALQNFCKQYAESGEALFPGISIINNEEIAVTFPYDISFETFCFAVNFLKYPVDVNWQADVKGWTTMHPGDGWAIPQLFNRKVMLYIPADDNEYDNVFAVTDDNAVYKLDFARSKAKPVDDQPAQLYHRPPVAPDDIAGLLVEEM